MITIHQERGMVGRGDFQIKIKLVEDDKVLARNTFLLPDGEIQAEGPVALDSFCDAVEKWTADKLRELGAWDKPWRRGVLDGPRYDRDGNKTETA